MLTSDKIIEIFVKADDFCKEFETEIAKHQLEAGNYKRRNRKASLADSEIMTILIAFHSGHFTNLKHFYIAHICMYYQGHFPGLVSYNRFVELQQRVAVPMMLFLKTNCLGQSRGINFIDSTHIRVCHNRRIHNHKVFASVAERGQCSIGWFYGFKLHLIIISQTDKIMLRKRAIIECVNDELKNICKLQHTRHRSINNFLMNTMGVLCAYHFFPKKPSLNIQFEENDTQLLLAA